jgi:glutamine synthetase
MIDLNSFATDRGIRYFLFSFSDLFGVQRAKLVPASAAAELAVGGGWFCRLCRLVSDDSGGFRCAGNS